MLGCVVLGQYGVGQQDGLSVTNADTGLSYSGIQAAINALETLDGHTIRVGAGIFMECVTVNKSVSLVGESQEATIIDGSGGGIVVYVTSSRVEVRNLSIRNGNFGLWLYHSNNSKIVDNKLYNGSYGIRLYHSRNSLVVGNHVSGYSYFGIQLDTSGNSTLRNNVIADNRYNFGVDGASLLDFQNEIDDSNTVDGKPVRYLIDRRDVVVDSSTFNGLGFLGVVNSSNVKVQNLDIQGNIQGVLLAFTSNSSIFNVNARNNWNGIYVAHSSNVSVSEVKSTNNFDFGIKFFNSPGSRAFRNNVESNGWAGIGVFKSHNSILDSNEASYGTYDLHIVYTNNSVITRNNALIRPGRYSIALYYSHNNSIYRNTFESSLLFAETRNAARFVPRNNWDNGLEGNYWMYYRGIDADQDGIGDASYRVEENNIDNCPLMGRFSEYNITVNARVYSVAFVSNSTITELQFNTAERRISFNAIGLNGTAGFCRVAVSTDFLNEFESDKLAFLVNGEEPVMARQWSVELYVFWYLSFANKPYQTPFDPLFVLAFLLFLILAGAAFGVFWKRRARSKYNFSLEVTNKRLKYALDLTHMVRQRRDEGSHKIS